MSPSPPPVNETVSPEGMSASPGVASQASGFQLGETSGGPRFGRNRSRRPVQRVETRDGEGAEASLTRLRWLAIIVPLAFLALLHYLLHTVLGVFHDLPGALFLFAWVGVGIAVFSFAIFAVIGRLERGIFERNRELAAFLAVGRAATSSLNPAETLDKAVDAILDVSSADAAEVWLARDGGELRLERRRGPAMESFQEGTSLRLDLQHRGETLGTLVVAARDPKALSSARERRLLEGIGEHVAIAIENSRLHERVLDRAVIEERERIARELHDGLAQVLGYINTQTLAVRKLLASGRSDDADAQLRAMEQAARDVYADVREAILGLRASHLAPGALIPSLHEYLRHYRDIAGANLRLEVGEEVEALRLPASTEIQLMRVIQEALSNVRKHARATTVTVSLEATDAELTVRVADDGQGFAFVQPLRTGWPRFGLQTMRERVEAIGGDFEVASSPGHGTTVTVHIPVRKTAEVSDEGLAG